MEAGPPGKLPTGRLRPPRPARQRGGRCGRVQDPAGEVSAAAPAPQGPRPRHLGPGGHGAAVASQGQRGPASSRTTQLHCERRRQVRVRPPRPGGLSTRCPGPSSGGSRPAPPTGRLPGCQGLVPLPSPLVPRPPPAPSARSHPPGRGAGLTLMASSSPLPPSCPRASPAHALGTEHRAELHFRTRNQEPHGTALRHLPGQPVFEAPTQCGEDRVLQGGGARWGTCSPTLAPRLSHCATWPRPGASCPWQAWVWD